MTTYSPDVAPDLEPEVVHWQPTHDAISPPVAEGWRALAGLALAAVAVGALATGAAAVGVLAIGSLKVGRARIGRLEIDELVVRRVGRAGG